MRIELSDEELNKMIDLYQQGIPCYKIGPQFGIIGGVTVENILKRNNIPLRGKLNTRKIKDDGEKQVISLYQQGLSANEIGKQFEVDGKAILKILKRNNIKSRGCNESKIKIPKEKESKIISLYLEGKSAIDIGKLFNVSNTPIWRILKKNNVPIKRPTDFRPTGVKKKRTNSNDLEVINLYQQGLSISDISKKFKLHSSTIKNVLKDNNIELKINITDKDKIKASELYKQGYSVSEISKIFGFNIKDILATLILCNITIRPKYLKKKVPLTLEQEQEIVRFYQLDHTLGGVMKLFKIGKPKVLSILRKNNIVVIKAKKGKPNQKQIIEIIELYKNGLTIKKISKKLGFSIKTITLEIKKNGLELKKGGGSNQKKLTITDEQEIIALYDK